MKGHRQFYKEEHHRLLSDCIATNEIKRWNMFNESLLRKGESAQLEGVDFMNADVSGVNLSKAHLEGVDFSGANLEKSDLSSASLERANLGSAILTDAELRGGNLKGAIFTAAIMGGADLGGAILEKTILYGAHLEGATLDFAILDRTDLSHACLRKIIFKSIHMNNVKFSFADLFGADFSNAQLPGSILHGARLENAVFSGADLSSVNLSGAFLSNTNFRGANLRGADLSGAHLEGATFSKSTIRQASFNLAICDAATLFSNCSVDKLTDFRSVSLESARFSPGLKQLLQYNNRRLNWEAWYKENKVAGFFVKPFWLFSDYGRSTQRIIGWFLGLSLVFALLYFFVPGMVDGFEGDGGEGSYTGFAKLVRAAYFSIVTMTTLGFGDITARSVMPAVNTMNYWIALAGHGLLMLQVIFGYLILGALVTRLSISFSSEDAPLAEFDSDDTRVSGLNH